MDNEQAMHALNLDDLYRVERTLAKGAGGLTELVTLGGAGPFVRKKTPLKLANQNVWAAIGSVDCPRVPKVQSTYLLPDQFVVVYSYVPGQTLQELVLSSGPLTTGKAAKLATEICEAAEALHACGVIHRDLSPRNIIVAADGAHLIDLGIARMHVDGATNDTTFLGTHGFAAPEQYGFAQTDARSDVYSIGRLLGFMLTGKEPDEDGYAQALTELEKGDAAGIAACVQRACAFEPSARYRSATEMAEAVRQAATQGCRPAPSDRSMPGTCPAPETAVAPKPTPIKKKTAALALVLAAVALVVAALLVATNSLAGTDASQQKETASASSSAKSSGASNAASNSSTISDSSEDLPIEIAESSWYVTSTGYANYVVGIRNTSNDAAVELPTVKATGYDTAGSVVFTKEVGAMVCAPGQTVYLDSASSIGKSALDHIDFKLLDSSATETRRITDPVTFTASAPTTRVRDGSFVTFTGTVDVEGTESALKQLAPYSSSLRVTIVLRDKSGAIVDGYSDYIDSLSIGTGQTYSVEMQIETDYATAEAYVQAW